VSAFVRHQVLSEDLKRLGVDVTLPETWPKTEANEVEKKSEGAAIAASGAGEPKGKAETLDEMHDAACNIRKLGWQVNAHAKPKKDCNAIGAQQNSLYKITNIKDDTVKFELVTTATNKPTVTVTIKDVLAQWSIHKGKTLERQTVPRAADPFSNTQWIIAEMSAKLCVAVRQACLNMQTDGIHTQLAYWVNPTMVVAEAAFAKGALVLAPSSTRVSSAVLDPTKPAPTVSKSAVQFGTLLKPPLVPMPVAFSLSPHLPIIQQDGQPEVTPWVAHYWVVQPTDDKVKANMEHFKVGVATSVMVNASEVNKFSVDLTMLRNKRAIRKGEELCFFKAAKAEPEAKKQRSE
jgi:hypothetical protein